MIRPAEPEKGGRDPEALPAPQEGEPTPPIDEPVRPRRFPSLPPLVAGAVLGWLTALIFVDWAYPFGIRSVLVSLVLRTTLGALVGGFLLWLLTGIITRLRPPVPVAEGEQAEISPSPQVHTPGTEGEYLPQPLGNPFRGPPRIRSLPEEEPPAAEGEAEDD